MNEEVICEAEYVKLKSIMNTNPSYLIQKYSKPFSEVFATEIMIILSSFIAIVIGFSLGEGLPTLIGGLSMIVFLGALIGLMFAYPNKSRKLEEDRLGSQQLTNTILKSSNYEEFKEMLEINIKQVK